MTVKELHREAMRFSDLALMAKLNNSFNEVKDYYNKAFEYERQAFRQFSSVSSEEPTRSVLIRSAATLAVFAERIRDAEKLISLGLSGEPPDEIADELRDLLQQVNFFRHLELHGLRLSSNELQLSLTGNEVGHGLIKSDEFLNRIEIIEKLAYRTADRFRGKPFNDRGRPIKSNVLNFQPYLSVPRAASFAITIRFGQEAEQQTFQGMDTQSALIRDILKNIQLINEDSYDQLNDSIKDESYRRNFIALTKQLAPDGDRIKLVGFTSAGFEELQTVSLTKVGKAFQMPSVDQSSSPVSEAVQLSGTLSYADSKRSRIKLTDAANVDHEIEVPQGLLSDVVKPYFEETVIIKGKRNGQKIELEDIEKIE